MLESLAAWVLRTYVGEYVENLNTDQLSIGYGTVDLHNLPLKKTALKGLELPLEVKSGFIGHLQLSIPLRRPKSEPWIIFIEKLYLVAGPLKQTQYNEEEEKEREQVRKQKQLDELEAQWQASRTGTQGGFWSGSWWPSLYSSFSTTIAENLQLVIRDVHIRYEDLSAERSSVFAFGITIAKLAAQSTNENWDLEDIIQNERMIKYKLIDLKDLGIYWDTDATLVGDLPSKDLQNALHRMISRNAGSVSFSKHQYVLEPISAQAKLRRNASALPLRARSMPRFVVDVHVSKIPLKLAQVQYSTFMTLMEAFERDFRQRRYRKWRPTVPVKNNGRKWWQFAITCILHFIQERNKRHTWNFVMQRARDVKAYDKIYTQHLVSSDLDTSQKEEQRRIEKEMTFEELASLRKISMNKAKELMELAQAEKVQTNVPGENPQNSSKQQSKAFGEQGAEKTCSPATGGGWQGWLTGWYGWYSAPIDGDSTDGSEGSGHSHSPPPFMREPATKEEEEFLDELADSHLNESIFNRDHVFAHLNFHLESGAFTLMDSTDGNGKESNLPKAIMEVEFSDVKWNSEVRPRSGTWEFSLSLGAMYVRDKVTTSTLFPLLVSPQTKPLTGKKKTGSSVGALAMSSASLGLNILQDIAEPPLFEIKFEQLPPSNKTSYKLSVTTQSVSFVYNPHVFKKVSGFFSRSSSLRAQSLQIERQLMEAARLRYEELKNQTKAELIHTFDAMVEGTVVGPSKSWDIQFEIAAPQIVVPESFRDKKASVVILDFGHFTFVNTPAINRKKQISQGEEQDDSFVTPPSTPPNEEESSTGPVLEVDLSSELSNEAFLESMYDRYTLNVTDIQMVVCKTTDKWADVLSQSFTTMDQHLVEKFTISLQLERRLIFTADPQFPSVTVSGKLPSLLLHVNELKLQALLSCINQLIGPKQEPPLQTVSSRVLASSTPLPSVDEGDIEESMNDIYYSMYTSNINLNDDITVSSSPGHKQVPSSLQDKTRELMEESRLVLVQFSVDKVSLGVHARGNLIAELQILGVKAHYVKRPYDMSVSLGVHGLRLVDALQSYGPEYELLLSSYDRPKPENVAKTPNRGDSTFTEAVTSAISAVAEIMKFPGSGLEPKTPEMESTCDPNLTVIDESRVTSESEDLILFEYQQLKPDSPSAVLGGALKVASLQFNSLHVTANQETLVSLITFFNEAFAVSLDSASGNLQQTYEEMATVENPQEMENSMDALELTATVRHIDVLLVRTVKANGVGKACRKVADVMVSNLTVQATFGEELFVDGALGGLRVGDLTPEGSLHKCVYTCGRPSDKYLSNEETSKLWSFPEDDDDDASDERAFAFTLVNPKKGTRSQRIIVDTVSGLDIEKGKIARNIQIKIHMASAQYVHTNRFLSELAICAGDFMDYAREVGETLRDAATSVAMGLVSKKRALADGLDYLSSSFVATGPTTNTGSRRQSIIADDNNDIFLAGDYEDGFPANPAGRRVYACIVVESPIVSLPRTSSSAEMLVAHLGQVTVKNTHLTKEAVEKSDDSVVGTVQEFDIDRVFVEIKDMSLNCLTLSSEETSRISLGQTLTESLMDEITRRPRSGDPILRETAFQLIVDRSSQLRPRVEEGDNGKPTIILTGKVVSPFMLELSTQTYSHLFATIESLTGVKETKLDERTHSKLERASATDSSFTAESPAVSRQKLSMQPKTVPVKMESCEPTKEKNFEVKTWNLLPSRSNSETSQETLDESGSMPLKAFLEVPHFSIKLCGELNHVEHDIVDIMLKDFSLSFDHSQPNLTHFDITLGGLLVEDLQEPSSFYRPLMASSVPLREKLKSRSLSASPTLSSSCPTVSDCGLSSNLSSSLPLYFPASPKASTFRTLSPLRPLFKSNKSPSLSAVDTISEITGASLKDISPSTCVKQKKPAEVLVHVKVLLVDKNCLDFVSKYKKISRFVDIDFNTLDTTINLQTWVMVLEFFGIGVQKPPHSQPVSPLSSMGPEDWASVSVVDEHSIVESFDEEPKENIEVNLRVSSLSLTLNKSQYPLAKAQVSGLTTQIDMRDGNFAAKGKLTAISVTDVSPHGALYREKFVTCGEEALSFDFFRYADPDPDEMRDWDLSLTLKMSSVQYIHTKRFQTELVAFCQHFVQLQEVLGRMRAASEGSEVLEILGRSPRVLMDIKAGNPVILIPRSSKSCDMLVANLGDLALVNRFIHEGDLGTLLHKQLLKRARKTTSTASTEMEVDVGVFSKKSLLLDCMQLELVDMDLFSAVRVPVIGQNKTSAFTYKRLGLKLLNEKCKLSLSVERNLDWAFSRNAPDFQFSGTLSSVCASLDYSQYRLILGLLGENLGEPLEQFEKPSSVLQDPLKQPAESEEVWTVLKMSIELVNVSLELLPIRLFENAEHVSENPIPSLARIDFLKSKLEVENFSDWSKTIDLVSQEVIFEDTRHQDMNESEPRVFTEVLLPRRSSSSVRENQSSLQFEVHYRDSLKTSLLTFLVNHSRIMLIMDYILDTYNFIMGRMFKDDGESKRAEDAAAQLAQQNEEPPPPPPPTATGVVTKLDMHNLPEMQPKTFELKVNLSGTEFVLLDNLDSADTNAVVLKITAVLAWRPHLQSQKWLSCSIQNLEVFSCMFSCEEDSALSIIDPMSALVELNNARRPTARRTAGLLDIAGERLPSVEISLQTTLNMRISYNDYKLYLTIFESVSRQLNKAIKTEQDLKQQPEEPAHQEFDDSLIKRLQELGFKKEDCVKALHSTSGRLDASATWLLENATPIIQQTTEQNGGGWQFAGFEVRAGSVCVCLIDDCGDNDMPLMEMSAHGVYLWHDLQSTGDGAAHGTLTVEYYNRSVSGWEPFVEPWKCHLHWQKQHRTSTIPERFLIKLDAPDRLDITVTTTLINMIKQTADSWSEDYYGANRAASGGSSTMASVSSTNESLKSSFDTSISIDSLGSPVHRPESGTSTFSDGSSHFRRRVPFVPYILRNRTGCLLSFATITSTPSKVIMTNTGLALSGRSNTTTGGQTGKMSNWREVLSGAEAPFEFSSREKLRHRDTHEFKVCQIVVQVEGWDQVSPVSVDRVGTFFRMAQPFRDHLDTSSMGNDVQPVRIVFEVTLEEGAQKVVTVRSALVVRNKLDVPVQIRMQPPLASQEPQILPTLHCQSALAVPLPCLMWQLYVQPHIHGVGFCSEPLTWKEALRSHTTLDYARQCYSTTSDDQKFRFCVAAKREGYPEDFSPQLNSDVQSKRLKLSPHPAHTLTLMPPLTLVNLLPCDMSYRIKSVACMGTIRAGKSVPIYSVNTDKALDMGISIENFSYCDNIRILRRQPGMVEYPRIQVDLQDPKKRTLTVICRVSVRPGGSFRIAIYAPYWMVNNTGIPLIFKQDGVPIENAGQFEEHEMARSLIPLPFSFSDRDAPFRCQMRVGKAYHSVTGRPVWSNPFSLDSPREFRQIHARQGNGRPDKVYDIGIDVRFGKGRYRDTRIVTFATRYQLQNKTQHTLAFSQRHFVRDQGTRNPDGTLTALPGALVLFHWARTDLDQLLCIRLHDVHHCQWSGGFRIHRDDSFHINMRSLNGFSLFVRVEVLLRGATYHVVFTDASQLPPPFRIDNMAEVAVRFFQLGTEDRLRSTLHAKQSVPYSWDEPTLMPELSVGVSNESSYVRYNMNILGPGERLYYYNPIYIVFTHTFTSVDGHVCGSVHLQQAMSRQQSFDMRELVFDVPQGTAVVLRRKEPHKRTQLWRMTGDGFLRHEGSSPPSDPRKPSSSVSGLVLDIDSLAPPTMGKYVKLVLSKPNPRRRHSQTWTFTEDGRMKCSLPGLYVQSQAGVKGLRDGADAVLGPGNITKGDHIPIEQCISTQKMRPGSGCLAVQIRADGPTRVLHIEDSIHQPDEDSSEKDWMFVEQKGGLRQTAVTSLVTEPNVSELEMQVRLAGGIGVSVINAVPEELVFASLEQIEIDYTRTSKTEGLEANIGRIQIDNQLYGGQSAVLLFATPVEKGSKEDLLPSQPAVHLTASREPTKLPNVDIYKNLEICVRKMTLQIDEMLLLKLLQFFGYVIHDDDATITNEEDDESLYDNQRSAVANTASSAKRYYFERLQLNSTQLKVSIGTVGRLPDDLQALKNSLGLILVNLEDATVDLESFTRSHPFETMSFYLDAISKHYTEDLRSQAAAIVGSVDFLGNPMGLFNDVSSGLEGLVKRGNVGGLFLNVAHGVSDSAAKITGSLSDGLWSASMDSKNQESRDAMRAERFGSSREHFVAGVKGLGMGLFGGLTSIVTQPFEGAQRKGVPGFVTGIGKGIVGTFAKPAAGVLDFASGTAAAVRGQATRSSRYYQPKPLRLRRNCFGPSGAIPPFSSTHAEGQEIMYKLNEYNLNERFVLSETVRRDKEDRLKAIITTEGVYFVRAKGTPSPEAIVLHVGFCDLFDCQILSADGKHYIELVRKADNSQEPMPSKNPGKRPRVRCDTSSVAQKVAQKINYAKGLYDEVQQTVKPETKNDGTPT